MRSYKDEWINPNISQKGRKNKKEKCKSAVSKKRINEWINPKVRSTVFHDAKSKRKQKKEDIRTHY